MKTSEPSSPLSPEIIQPRMFIKEGPVLLSSVSTELSKHKGTDPGLLVFNCRLHINQSRKVIRKVVDSL